MYYIDNNGNTDPWLNLALEEYVVRQLDKNNDYLLLYINAPSIIIGKHQNVIEEVNLINAGQLGIPIIRRISGGGTVYHDTGNLNFSVITNQTLKNFNKYLNFLKPVLEVLKDLNLDASLNKRNNILINDKKISGNAQFTSRQRLLSHGTLLVDSDLKMIKRLIKPENPELYHSKSTKSIRSTITSISQRLKHSISAEDVKQKILHKIFGESIITYELGKSDWIEIEELAANKYKTWDWNYGLSPECRINKSIDSDIGVINLEILIADGLIKSLSVRNQKLNEKQRNTFCQYFTNQPYDYVTIRSLQDKINKDASLNFLNELSWIKILLN